MIAFLYLLPLLSCGVLFAITSGYYEWHVYASVVGGSMAFTGLIHWLMYRHRTRSTEYLGSFIYSIYHYDAWVELQVYYEQVSDGKGGYKRVRRVREIYHPEQYEYYTSIGSSYWLDSYDYDRIRSLWGTPVHRHQIYGTNIVGGVRHYQTYEYSDFLDGMFSTDPFENIEVYRTMIPITETHRYVNKIKNSNSIFRFEDISEKQAEDLGLWDYPNVEDSDMSPILGLDVDNVIEKQFRLFNAYYGAIHQIRLFVIFFDSATQGIDVAEKQRAYWKGGNKNEFVICLGISKGKVGWCHAFSWMDEPVLSVKIESYFHSNQVLDMRKMLDWLREHLYEWKRKEFSDFKYIKVELTTFQYWTAFALTVAANVAVTYLLVEDANKSSYFYDNWHNSSNSEGYYDEYDYDTSNFEVDTLSF